MRGVGDLFLRLDLWEGDVMNEPAFHVSTRVDKKFGGFGHCDGEATYQFGGMTLRDYFAAKALNGLIANPNLVGPMGLFAKKSYAYADAMLTEREDKP